VIELPRELVQDLGRAIGGHVVGDEDAVAESGDVLQRLPDEAILVPYEADADDLQEAS
jgi:hypothetical protein